MKIKRKVVCVWGEFKETGDFVLEPVCNNPDCEECKKGFWIEGEL